MGTWGQGGQGTGRKGGRRLSSEELSPIPNSRCPIPLFPVPFPISYILVPGNIKSGKIPTKKFVVSRRTGVPPVRSAWYGQAGRPSYGKAFFRAINRI
ncbi:MAG: hypothetical protein F6J93_31730 [Oscillatoria sp. SIO1A7]|nr:hypothetical protein [Oscillatoria sp. SIO1A7]